MKGKRVQRLNEQFKREVTEILRTKVRDPRVATVRVTGADVTSDLWFARLYVHLPVEEPARGAAVAGLDAALPFVRRALAQVLRIRRIPELRFVEDETENAALRIETILRAVVVPEEGPDDLPSEGDLESGDSD